MSPRIGPVVLAALFLSGVAACSKESPSAVVEKSPTPSADAEKSPAPAAEAQAVKLCEHGVPAELCTKCNPELVDVFKEQGDWCGEHGLPESHCRQCNPGLSFTAQATPPQDWCGEHAVPESKCTKCKPQLIAKFIAAGDYCREHGYPESVCPYCHPEIVKAAGKQPPQFPEPGTRVRLASTEIERKAGLTTQRAEPRPFAQTLEVVGQLEFNQNRLAQLSARGEALIAEVKVDAGDEVKAGQPLVVLTSAGVGESQAQLVASKARLEAARAALARE